MTERTFNGKIIRDYGDEFFGRITIDTLCDIQADTLAIPAQRAKADLLLELIERSGIALNSINFGTADCHTVGGSTNGENGGNFELLVSEFLKNKYRISPKGKNDIIKYITVNGKRKAITIDTKQSAGDLGYYSKDGALKTVTERYICWTPRYYDGMSLKNTVVLPTRQFINAMRSIGLLREKKRTNSLTYKMSIQNINSFRMVKKVMNLLDNSMNLIEFCNLYNLTVKA